MCAPQLLEKFVHWGAKLGQDHVVDLSLLSQLSDTALTSEREIEMNAGGLPNTFVPVRNLLFFTVAASVADRRGLSVLIGGCARPTIPATPTAATTPSSRCRSRSASASTSR
jgi:7-cyano-7-deazaguanine synthase